MLGVLVGVFMYQTMKNCLQILGFNSNAQLVLTGIILILAVAIDVFKGKLSLKRK
jgi:methyl-galactoside transport system permease protein